MGDGDSQAAQARIDALERRIASLQDAGVDVAPLRAHLAFAHRALEDQRLTDVEAICVEVQEAARRLAELGQRASSRPPTVRTPTHGTPVPQEPGTEAVQRVKVGRAQLADEVRAAIDSEVRAQMAVSPPVAMADSALSERMAAVEQRLAEVVGHAADAQAVAQRLHALADRLAVIESGPSSAGLDAVAVEAIVQRSVAESVPRQAAELLREAISKLPTRDDLQQIADTLRADLDWRLEKSAAEHGWCSLADVQATVRKAVAEQDPVGGGSQLGRLEIALAEFVQQSKDQQERLIAVLANRVVQHTKSLTKRMLVREEPADIAPRPRSDTEELAPSHSQPPGEGSSRLAAITAGVDRTAPGKSPTELSLDPIPPETIDESRKQHGNTTLMTKRVPAVVVEPPQVYEPDLNDLVTAEVERALSAAVASTLGEAQPSPEIGHGSSSAAGLSVAPAPTAPMPADWPVLIAAEVGRQLAHTVPVHLPPSDADLARAVARVLPQALQDESVRTELFAVLALEAAGKPGVLGEMTGLRRYLKRELAAAVEQLGGQLTV